MDVRTLELLLSAEGWALLRALPPYDEALTLALSERLRRDGLEPELIAAALTQSRLRAAARAKFADFADGMLFTQAGLEQATRLVVAARHAQRFAAAGCTRVADLTCGLGGDAMAMAALGLDVLAVDVDEAAAALATVNLRHFPNAEVRHADGITVDLADVDGVFADPARRTARGRRHDPAAYSPPLDAVLEVRTRVAALGVKVGPGIPHSAVPDDAEAQWVSVDGDVVEAGLWFGPLAPDGPGRSALLLTDGGSRLLRSGGPIPTAPVGELSGYLLEPDGAVIRAGLVALAAAEVDGRLVDPTIAYVTADRPPATDLGRAYRVLDHLPFQLKRLRAYLRDRGVGRLTIKKRGTAVDPADLRRRLALTGDAEATIVLTRVRGAQTVILVEPL